MVLYVLMIIIITTVCKRSSGRIDCDNYIHITRPEVKNSTYQRRGSLLPTNDRILITRSLSTSRDHMHDKVCRWQTETSQLGRVL